MVQKTWRHVGEKNRAQLRHMGMAGVSAPNDLTFGLSKVLIDKSRFEFVHVRLGEWLGWPQASPREPLRCHISSLVIVET